MRPRRVSLWLMRRESEMGGVRTLRFGGETFLLYVRKLRLCRVDAGLDLRSGLRCIDDHEQSLVVCRWDRI